MENYLFYILSIWGLTHILVSSKIMESTRNWLIINVPFIGDMLNCYQCTSFWASMILYFMFDGINIGSPIIFGINIGFIVWSFIGSGIISFMAVIMSILINKSKR